MKELTQQFFVFVHCKYFLPIFGFTRSFLSSGKFKFDLIKFIKLFKMSFGFSCLFKKIIPISTLFTLMLRFLSIAI